MVMLKSYYKKLRDDARIARQKAWAKKKKNNNSEEESHLLLIDIRTAGTAGLACGVHVRQQDTVAMNGEARIPYRELWEVQTQGMHNKTSFTLHKIFSFMCAYPNNMGV